MGKLCFTFVCLFVWWFGGLVRPDMTFAVDWGLTIKYMSVLSYLLTPGALRVGRKQKLCTHGITLKQLLRKLVKLFRT